jgi:hypothetical protein
VQSLSPPKQAGLDPPPQIFAGLPQIGSGTPIAQKNSKKIFHGKFSNFFLEIFFSPIFFGQIFS